MKRIEDVRAVLLVYEQNHSPTYRDKIRMWHMEAAAVGKMNRERMEIWSQSITNWLEV